MGFSVYRKTRYNSGVIISFKDEETRKIFMREWSKKIPRDIQTIAYCKLAMLHSANALINLQSPPGNQLEKMHRDRTGQYSVRINDRWRICFELRASDAHNVEIVDYHG
jgi:proteic killer suppression protein